MAGPDFAYAQARLQARHGGLPDALTWQLLETSHTAGHYLTVARAGPLARWVDGLADATDARRVEQWLRAAWRRYVDEVAGWQPARWQAATRWFGTLPELPLTAAALDGQPGARWLVQWQRTMPAGCAVTALLRRVAELLMPGLSAAGGARGAASAPVRRALTQLFRHHGGSAVAACAHLALVALDVERLRGGLVTRSLLQSAAARATAGGPAAREA